MTDRRVIFISEHKQSQGERPGGQQGEGGGGCGGDGEVPGSEWEDAGAGGGDVDVAGDVVVVVKAVGSEEPALDPALGLPVVEAVEGEVRVGHDQLELPSLRLTPHSVAEKS